MLCVFSFSTSIHLLIYLFTHLITYSIIERFVILFSMVYGPDLLVFLRSLFPVICTFFKLEWFISFLRLIISDGR